MKEKIKNLINSIIKEKDIKQIDEDKDLFLELKCFISKKYHNKICIDEKLFNNNEEKILLVKKAVNNFFYTELVESVIKKESSINDKDNRKLSCYLNEKLNVRICIDESDPSKSLYNKIFNPVFNLTNILFKITSLIASIGFSYYSIIVIIEDLK